LPDELIIVDASTSDNTRDMVDHLNCSFKIVYARQRKGGSATARNIGAKTCTGDIGMFLDDDVVLDPLYVEEIMTTYAEDREGKIGGAAGLEIKSQRARTSLEKFLHLLRVLFFWDSPKDGKITPIGMLSGLPITSSYVEALYGHNMSFRKHILAEFEFDKELEIYPLAMGEDIDFSYRVGKKYLLKVNPRAKLVHEGPSLEDYKFTFQYYRSSSMMFIRNFYLIMCKNIGKSLCNKMAFLWAIAGFILGRLLLYLIYPAEKRKAGLKGIAYGLKLIVSGL